MVARDRPVPGVVLDVRAADRGVGVVDVVPLPLRVADSAGVAGLDEPLEWAGAAEAGRKLATGVHLCSHTESEIDLLLQDAVEEDLPARGTRKGTLDAVLER